MSAGAERLEAPIESAAPATDRVPLARLIAYSLIELPVAGPLTVMALYLGFRYAELGVGLAAIGTIGMIARLLDVAIDPACGALSDRTRTPFGRRRPWIAVGAPLFGFATWRLFLPPSDVDATYYAVWLVLFWLGFSMLNIPYYAWGAELSADYRERTRITSARSLAGSLGALACILIPTLSQRLRGVGGTADQVLSIVAFGLAIGLPIAVVAALALVPDRGAGGASVPFLRGAGVMARNRPFLQLLAAFTLVGLGPALQGPMFPFFMTHVVKRPEVGPEILLFYYFAVPVGVGLWAFTARRLDKHRAWMCGMGVMVVATSLYLFVGEGDVLAMKAILTLSGIGSGAFAALPASMKADVVDLDALESGEDRAGIFFAAWSLAVKAISAFGVGIAFNVLFVIGFVAKGVNGPDEILGLRIFYSAGPMLLYFVGMLLITGYPITAARHAELRLRLAQRDR